MNDLIAIKAVSIQRCVARAREELAAAGAHFTTDYTHQDAAILNLLRACETAIDLANVLIRQRRLGLPQSSTESFDLLLRAGVIDAGMCRRLRGMVGFRNIAIHQYRELDPLVVEAILRKDIQDLDDFAAMTLKQAL
jgi:uncharacterized protein YutE (UPF0331/DUF86 family)